MPKRRPDRNPGAQPRLGTATYDQMTQALLRVLARYSDPAGELAGLSAERHPLLGTSPQEFAVSLRGRWPRGGGVPEAYLPNAVAAELRKAGLRPPARDSRSWARVIGDMLQDAKKRRQVVRMTGEDAEYETFDGQPVRGKRAWKVAPPGGAGGNRSKRPRGTEGFVSADWFWSEHGIAASRLSEGGREGTIRKMHAPKGYPRDSQGRAVRTLYNVADALKHCSPKRVTQKTRRKLGRDNS